MRLKLVAWKNGLLCCCHCLVNKIITQTKCIWTNIDTVDNKTIVYRFVFNYRWRTHTHTECVVVFKKSCCFFLRLKPKILSTQFYLKKLFFQYKTHTLNTLVISERIRWRFGENSRFVYICARLYLSPV